MLLNFSAKVPFSGGGEMADDPVLVPLLLGLGVESLMLSSAQEIYAKCEAFCRARVKLN